MRKTLLVIKVLENDYPISFLSTEKITLIENDEIINNDSETSNVMNTFFSKIVANLDFLEYHDCEDISGNF